MSYDTVLKVSGWIDEAIGISGLTLTLGWDLVLGRSIQLGLRGWIAIVASLFFIYKGYKQKELAG